VVASNNDPVLPISLAETVYSRLPNARLAIVPGARHLVMIAEPERLNREVLKTLRRSGER
jgi:pimeloyl-ACP methyl ester carboxylesterase